MAALGRAGGRLLVKVPRVAHLGCGWVHSGLQKDGQKAVRHSGRGQNKRKAGGEKSKARARQIAAGTCTGRGLKVA